LYANQGDKVRCLFIFLVTFVTFYNYFGVGADEGHLLIFVDFEKSKVKGAFPWNWGQKSLVDPAD